jgi:hypothetical protein
MAGRGTLAEGRPRPAADVACMVPRGVEVLMKKAAIDEEFRSSRKSLPPAASGLQPEGSSGPSRRSIVAWTAVMAVVVALAWFTGKVAVPTWRIRSLVMSVPDGPPFPTAGRLPPPPVFTSADDEVEWISPDPLYNLFFPPAPELPPPDPSEWMRTWRGEKDALNSLQKSGLSITALKRYLRMPEFLAPRKKLAVNALAGFGKKGLPVLQAIAYGDDDSLHVPALVALADIGEDALPVLDEALRYHPTPQGRAAAMWAYVYVSGLGRETITRLVLLLDDPNVRTDAAQWLVCARRPKLCAVTTLAAALSNKSAPLRAGAAYVLARIADREAARSLGFYERDLYLYRSGRFDRSSEPSTIDVLEGCVPRLRLLLNDPDRNVRTSAASAIWQITGKTDGLVLVLADGLRSKGTGAACHAAIILAEMGPDARDAIPALRVLARQAGLRGQAATCALSLLEPAPKRPEEPRARGLFDEQD